MPVATKTMYLLEKWKSIKFHVISGKLKFFQLCLLFYSFILQPIFGFNVDIEKPLIFNGTLAGSHFGYSVALLKNPNGISLMIAAPKFNADGNSGGMLFECQLSGQELMEKYQKCTTQVPLSGDSSTETQSYDEKQWLGVAMDVNEQAEKFIVCAHRWCEIVSKQLRMVGACYILSTSIKDHKILAPLLDKPKKNGVFYQGMAQFGTSAQFSKNNKDILFGAPGIYQGRGGFVIKDILNDNFTTVDYSNSENHKVYSQEEYEDSMVGYSITSGRFFFNKIQIAVGGPGPSTFGLGKVLIYSGEMLIGRYAGSQYGGGFGSSLASGNFSGDEHDDLVVGAPMEYDVVDEGRVYILISTGLGSFMENKIVLVGDNIPGSRFGTTVANIGDLNQDGIDDIAIGAPYENGCGAVYIYYGNLISIDEKKRQKIIGKSLSPELKGFGISFSRPKDVDNNGYLDFAVGAFLSDQAVLLHTKPVIKSNTTVQSSPSELNPQDTDCFGDIFKDGCLNLSVSINLLGKAFKKVDLEVKIIVDAEKNEKQKRAELKKAEDNYIQTELGLNNQFHKIYQLKTRKGRDLFKPVVIKLMVIVQTNETEMNISPIQDLLEPNIIKYEIPFLNDCGADKLCAVDLQTRLKWLGKERNNVLLIGGEHQFRIGITIANGYEPAYQPSGTLVYPDYINYVSYLESEKKVLGCQFESTRNSSQSDTGNKVICIFNNPLRKGLLYYELIFDIPQVYQTVGEFAMKFSVSSEGFEMYPKNNEALLNIQMRKKAVLSVNTVSEPQYILVSQKKESKSATDIKDITHQYSFYNNGPSDLKAGNFTLKVYKIGSLLSNLDPQVNSSGTFPHINCLSKTFNNKPQFYEMKCHFKEWLKESLFLIEVYMKMDIAKLDSTLPVVKSELLMNSVKDKDYVDDVAIEEKIYSVSTNLRSPGQPKPVKTWIIVLCVVFGILLLLGFIAGLWKCGFFKRQKVHRIRQHDGSMKQEVQPDPDSEPLN